MKLLLSTIRTENRTTDLILNNLYTIIEDTPIDARLRRFDPSDTDYDIYVHIIRERYAAVYFHCDQFNEVRINHICEMIKQVSSTIIIVGGMEVSFDTRQYMTDNPYVDYVIRGEGEAIFYNFIRCMLIDENDYEDIEGLAYRRGDEIYINPYAESVDLEKMPFIYDKVNVREGDTIYYETIRGTSDRSIFQQFLPDVRVRSLPVGRVCTEVRYLIIKNVGKVVFLDRWFNFDADRAYRIIEHIIFNDNNKTTFEMDLDGENINEELVRLLEEARPGLLTFNVDIDTVKPDTLKAIGRESDDYQLMNNVSKLMRNSRINVRLKIKAGLPMETMGDFANTFNKVYGLGYGKSIIIETARVPRGCHLREDASKYGCVFTKHPPYDVLATSQISGLEIIKIQSMAKVVKTYINEHFRLTIPHVLNDTALKPFDLFFSLSEFIYNYHLESRLKNKEDRYRVLYRFAVILYNELDNIKRIKALEETMKRDMSMNMTADQVLAFERKGWDLDD